MVSIDDLTGIEEDKKKKVLKCLDDLLVHRDGEGELSPIISGYNGYDSLASSNRVVTLQHVHETDAYRIDMIRDLERLDYQAENVLNFIRKKGTTILWNPKFRIRKDNGELYPGLRIRDTRTGSYITLRHYTLPLINYPEFRSALGYLVADNQGWELDMPFNSKEELKRLTDLFLKKAGIFAYDIEGREILEDEEARSSRAPWTDAYRTPVLILGEAALVYKDELPAFDAAVRIILVENNSEISFIIHNKLSLLRASPTYEQLRALGFREEPCLGNKPFLKVIDETR